MVAEAQPLPVGLLDRELVPALRHRAEPQRDRIDQRVAEPGLGEPRPVGEVDPQRQVVADHGVAGVLAPHPAAQPRDRKPERRERRPEQPVLLVAPPAAPPRDHLGPARLRGRG
jgi:hypothetical protein